MADDDVTTKKEEASGHHDAATERAAEQPPGQPDMMRGEGNQPPDLGYAPPDEGSGGDVESEIPTGVDQLDPDKVAAAKESAESSEGGEGALDLSQIMAESDEQDATAETDTGGDEGETVSEGDEGETASEDEGDES